MQQELKIIKRGTMYKAIVITIAFAIGHFIGVRSGGARQMARHILNPHFHTDSFDIIANKERGYGVIEKGCTCESPNLIVERVVLCDVCGCVFRQGMAAGKYPNDPNVVNDK